MACAGRIDPVAAAKSERESQSQFDVKVQQTEVVQGNSDAHACTLVVSRPSDNVCASVSWSGFAWPAKSTESISSLKFSRLRGDEESIVIRAENPL